MHAVETRMNPPTLARLETDRLCHKCGYNLHGQVVWRDERLQILLCRCPECGQHHPAEGGVTMGSLWLRRVTTMLLILWMLGVILVSLAILLTQFGFTIASLDRYNVSRLMAYLNLSHRRATISLTQTIAPVVGVGFCSFILYCLWSLVAHHVPQRRLAGLTLIPIFTTATAIILLIDGFDGYRHRMVHGFWVMVPIVVCVLFIGLGAGHVAARPIWRALVRLLLSPQHRNAMATLWTSDGRTPPG